METMQAAVFLGEDRIELQTRNIPKVTPGSLLLRVESCAICGSDVRIVKHGNERVIPPRIIGHEISGQVVELGADVSNFKVGDRLAIGADVPCGECNYCNEGIPNCCDTNFAIGYQFDGGFAQYMLLNPLVVSKGPVQKIPNELEYDLAALAEPLACCLNGYEIGMMKANKSVVIFGAGPIGTLLGMLGSYLKASNIIMIDPNAARLKLAREMGIQHTLNPNECDVVTKVKEMTNSKGADLIFTACPSVETHEQAINMVAKRGVVNFFGGLPKSSRPASLYSNQLHYREAYITGSHGSTPKQHAKAVSLISNNVIPISKLISHRLPLSQIHEGISLVQSGNSMKVVINPNA